jgi:Protein of unknown function (DUF3800)
MASSRDVSEFSRAVLGGREIAVLKIYMDESGVHDGSPVVTVAAYVGRPRDWKNWTKKWNVAKRPIKVYHAADAQALKGEFEGWSESDRDDVVKRVLPVIADSDLPGIVIGIQMDEFRRAIAGKGDLQQFLGEPYAACFQWVIQSIMFLQARTGNTERMAFVHESNDYRNHALEAFNYVQKFSNPNGTKLSIRFGDKSGYPPLQAADILAYEGNRRMRDPGRPERRPWQVLNPDGRILASHYGGNNMHKLISNLERIRAGLPVEIDQKMNWLKVLRGERETRAV